MTHDIDDLLDYVKSLELRIIELEKELTRKALHSLATPDAWYWNN